MSHGNAAHQLIGEAFVDAQLTPPPQLDADTAVNHGRSLSLYPKTRPMP